MSTTSQTSQRRSSKEQFWRQLVRQWRSSGLSIRDFCAKRGLLEASFYAWRRTIAERDAAAARFVPVHVVVDQRQAAKEECGQGLELLLASGRVVRIGSKFDEPTLRRLLAVLEGQP